MAPEGKAREDLFRFSNSLPVLYNESLVHGFHAVERNEQIANQSKVKRSPM